MADLTTTLTVVIVSPTTLRLTIPRAADHTAAILRVEDGSRSGTAALEMEVLADRIGFRNVTPSSSGVRPGGFISADLYYFDAAGNQDVDPRWAPQESISPRAPTAAELLSGSLATGGYFSYADTSDPAGINVVVGSNPLAGELNARLVATGARDQQRFQLVAYDLSALTASALTSASALMGSSEEFVVTVEADRIQLQVVDVPLGIDPLADTAVVGDGSASSPFVVRSNRDFDVTLHYVDAHGNTDVDLVFGGGATPTVSIARDDNTPFPKGQLPVDRFFVGSTATASLSGLGSLSTSAYSVASTNRLTVRLDVTGDHLYVTLEISDQGLSAQASLDVDIVGESLSIFDHSPVDPVPPLQLSVGSARNTYDLARQLDFFAVGAGADSGLEHEKGDVDYQPTSQLDLSARLFDGSSVAVSYALAAIDGTVLSALSGLHLTGTLPDGIDNSTAIVSVVDGGTVLDIAGSLSFQRVVVIGEQLQFTVPPTWRPGEGILLSTPLAYDRDGNRDVDYALSNAASLSVVVAQTGDAVAVSRSSTSTLSFNVAQTGLVDNATLTLTLSDTLHYADYNLGTASHVVSGQAQSKLDIVATRLRVLGVPPVAAVGQTYNITVQSVDANGNVDGDIAAFILASTSTLSASNPQTAAPVAGSDLGQLILTADSGVTLQLVPGNLPGGGGLSLRIADGIDQEAFTLRVEQSGLQGSASSVIGTVPSQLVVTAPATVVAGQAFTVSVAFRDENDNTVASARLGEGVQISASNGDIVLSERSLLAGELSLGVTVLSAIDQSTMILTVTDLYGGSIQLSGASNEVTVDVQAERLELSPVGDSALHRSGAQNAAALAHLGAISSGAVVVAAGRAFEVGVRALDALGNVDTGLPLSNPEVSARTLLRSTRYDNSDPTVGLVLMSVTQALANAVVTVLSPQQLSVTIIQAGDHTSATLRVVQGGISGSVSVEMEVEADRISLLDMPSTLQPGQAFSLPVRYYDAADNEDVDPVWGAQGGVQNIELREPTAAERNTISAISADSYYVYAVDHDSDAPRALNFSLDSTAPAVAGSLALRLDTAGQQDGQNLRLDALDRSAAASAFSADGSALPGSSAEATVLVDADRLALRVDNVPAGLYSTDTTVVGDGSLAAPFVVRAEQPFDLVVSYVDAFGNVDADLSLTEPPQISLSRNAASPSGFEVDRSALGRLSSNLGTLVSSTLLDTSATSQANTGRVPMTLEVSGDRLYVDVGVNSQGLSSTVTLSVDIVATALAMPIEHSSLSSSSQLVSALPVGDAAIPLEAVGSWGVFAVNASGHNDIDFRPTAFVEGTLGASAFPATAAFGGTDVEVLYRLVIPTNSGPGYAQIQRARVQGSSLPANSDNSAVAVSFTDNAAALSGTIQFDQLVVVADRLTIDVPAVLNIGQAFTISVLAATDSDGNRDADYVLVATQTVSVGAVLQATGSVLSATVLSVAGDALSVRLDTHPDLLDGSTVSVTVSDVLSLRYNNFADSGATVVEQRNISGQAQSTVDIIATRLQLQGVPAVVTAGQFFDVRVLPVDDFGTVDNAIGNFFLGSASSVGTLSPSNTQLSDADRRLSLVTISNIQVAVENRSDGLGGVRLRVVLGADDERLTLVFTQGSLEGSASAVIGIAPVALVVSAPAAVVVGQPFPVTVDFVDGLGNISAEAALSASVQLSAADANIAFASVTRLDERTLQVELMRAVDNSSTTLTVTDFYNSVSLSGASGSVEVAVEGDRLRLSPVGNASAHNQQSGSAAAAAHQISTEVVVVAGRDFDVGVQVVDRYANVDDDRGLSSAVQVSALVLLRSGLYDDAQFSNGTEVLVSHISTTTVTVISPTMLRVAILRAADHSTATLRVSEDNLSGEASLEMDVLGDRIRLGDGPNSVLPGSTVSFSVSYWDADGNQDVDPLFAYDWSPRQQLDIELRAPTAAELAAPSPATGGYFFYTETASFDIALTPVQSLGRVTFQLTQALDNQTFRVMLYDHSAVTAALVDGSNALMGISDETTATVIADRLGLRVENVPPGLDSTSTIVVGDGSSADPFVVRSDRPFDVVVNYIDEFGNADADRALLSTTPTVTAERVPDSPAGYVPDEYFGGSPSTRLGTVDLVGQSVLSADRLSMRLGVTGDGLHVRVAVDDSGSSGEMIVAVDIVATDLAVVASIDALPMYLPVGDTHPSAWLSQRYGIVAVGPPGPQGAPLRIDVDYRVSTSTLTLSGAPAGSVLDYQTHFPYSDAPDYIELRALHLDGQLAAGADNEALSLRLVDARYDIGVDLNFERLLVIGTQLRASVPVTVRPGQSFDLTPLVAVDNFGNVDEDYRFSSALTASVTAMGGTELPVTVDASTANQTLSLLLGVHAAAVDNALLAVSVSDTLYYADYDGSSSLLPAVIRSVPVSGSDQTRIDIIATRLQAVEPPAVVRANLEFSIRIRPLDDFGNLDADFPDFAISSTSTLSPSSPNSPVPGSDVVGQLSLVAGDIVIDASPLAPGSGAIFSLQQGNDGDLFTLRFSQAGLSGDVTIEVGIIAESMQITLPAEVQALVPFDVLVSFFDGVGNPAARHRLTSSATISVQTAGFSVELLARTVTNTLTVRMVQALDNSIATVTVSDQSLLGELRDDDTVLVRVVPDRVVPTAPALVTALVPFEVALSYRDAAGNIDADFGAIGPSAAASVAALATSTEIVASDGNVEGGAFMVEVRRAVDRSQLDFSVSDRGLQGSTSVTVDVVGSVLSASAPATATPAVAFLLDVDFFDTAGNRDVDLSYFASEVDNQLSVTAGGVTIIATDSSGSSQAGPMVTIVDAAQDGQQITISVERTAFVSDSVTLLVDVQAESIRLIGPSTATVGTAMALMVEGADRYGNTDTGYQLPNDVANSISLSVEHTDQSAVPSSDYSYARGGERRLWLNVHRLADNTTLQLSVSADSLPLLNTISVQLNVLADRLQLSEPDNTILFRTGRLYRFDYMGVDANGNEDTDYIVTPADVSLSISRNAAITVNSLGSFQIEQATDLATVVFTAGDGQIKGYYQATVIVFATRISVRALNRSVVPGGLSAALVVSAVDSFGNISLTHEGLDLDFVRLEVLDSTGSISNASLCPSQSVSNNQALCYYVFGQIMLIYGGTAEDGAQVRVRVYEDNPFGAEGGGLEASNPVELLIDVVATRVDLSAPFVLIPGSTATISYSVSDHFGNIDKDIVAVSLSIENFSGDYTLSSVDSSYSLVVSRAFDGEVLRLVANAGGLLGTTDILVDVQADQLQLGLPTVVQIDSYFRFTVDAVDRYGNIDRGWLPPAELSLAMNPDIGTIYHFGPRATDHVVVAYITGVGNSLGERRLTVTDNDSGLSGAGSVTLLENAEILGSVTGLRLQLANDTGSMLRVGSTVTLTVSGLFENGLVNPAWAPDSSLSITILGVAPGTLLSELSVSGELGVNLPNAVDNIPLTLVASYPGLSEGRLQVIADVLGDRLNFSQTNYTMTPGVTLQLPQPTAVDANGNIDTDQPIPLSSARIELVDTVGNATLSLSDNQRTLSLDTQAADGAVIEFRFIDTSRDSVVEPVATLYVTVDVVGSQLGLSHPSNVTVGAEFVVTAQLQDSFGNADISQSSDFSAQASLQLLTAGVIFSHSFVAAELRVMLSGITDQSTVAFRLSDGALGGDFDVLADVVADRVSVQLPTVVQAGVAVSGRRQPVDRFGNIDTASNVSLAALTDTVRLVGLSVADNTANTAAGGSLSASGESISLLVQVGRDRQTLRVESLAENSYPLSGSAAFILDVVADSLRISGPADIREGVLYDAVFAPQDAQGSVDIDLLPVVSDGAGGLALRSDVSLEAELSFDPSMLNTTSTETDSGVFSLQVTASSLTDTVRLKLVLPAGIDIEAMNTTAMLSVDYAGFTDTLSLRAQPPVALDVAGDGDGLSVSDALLIVRVLTLPDVVLDSDPSQVIVGFSNLTESDAIQIIADVRLEIERNPDLLDLSDDGVVDVIDGNYLNSYLVVGPTFAVAFLQQLYGLSSADAEAAVTKIEILIATVVE